MTTGKSTDQAADSAPKSTGTISDESSNVVAENTATVSKDKVAQDASDKAVSTNAEPTKDNTAREYGGPKGLEPTRYGDWEKNGRCSDF